MLRDNAGEPAARTELICPVPAVLLASNEPRAPIVHLSPAKRAALIAGINGGTLQKQSGVWRAPSASTCDKPIAGNTVADLARDGMLTLTKIGRNASPQLTARGSWYARTALAETVEQVLP